MTIQECIRQAISQRKNITIEYIKYDGTRSKRTLSDIRYSEEFGNNYITAFCHLRKEERTFKISRIQSVNINTQMPSSDNSSSSKTTYTTKNEGCYIATMVYGDYDHPQVVTLRRFRDKTLLNTAYGAAFVRFYYLISPKLVNILKGHERINGILRYLLNGFIRRICHK